MSIQFNTTEIIFDTLKNESSEQLSKVLDTLHRNDINKLSPHGMAPIHQACLDGELEMLECLLQHNADPSLQDIEGWTPLHIAAATHNYELTVRLLSEGADPCIYNNDEETASDIAEEEDILSLLNTATIALTASTDGEEDNNQEETDLLEALKKAHKHNNVNKWEQSLNISEEGSILHLAAAYGYTSLVEYICEENVINMNTRDSEGWTPLHVASYWRQTDIVVTLLSHGADVNLTTKLYSKFTDL
ncbi:Protein phosphatase 1 regulatory subunit 12A-like [Oopsacas minuta]|uniref:Protein phosphatase 1 regulatory subunit 12A-like n=1 Tax=Oopsacas minuta TaxID=111878 RepID=A0AAV7JSW9_9METZ|nr:Protein phosphatase 1 regulatory subunit 12A-like [Oopsacas minuta]